MKNLIEITKPKRNSLADQLKKMEVGQEALIHIDEYKVNAIRQAAYRLKKEGIILKVTEKGYRHQAKVVRIS